MIDEAGWECVKNCSRADAEITDDQGAGCAGLHAIANRFAPCILKFLGDDGRNLAPRALQSAMEDRPRSDSVRIAVAEDAKLGIG